MPLYLCGAKLVCSAACGPVADHMGLFHACLLYTSDAADERSSVDLGGRRIIKKKNTPDTREGGLTNINSKVGE